MAVKKLYVIFDSTKSHLLNKMKVYLELKYIEPIYVPPRFKFYFIRHNFILIFEPSLKLKS